MKPLYALLLLAMLTLVARPAAAQERKPHFTKEAFREQQQQFIITHAHLTPQEAAQFFPLYFELQEKKHQLGSEMEALLHPAPHQAQESTNADATTRIDKYLRARMELDLLEQAYVEKYRQFLTDETILLILGAQTQLHRELLKRMQRDTPPHAEGWGNPQKR